MSSPLAEGRARYADRQRPGTVTAPRPSRYALPAERDRQAAEHVVGRSTHGLPERTAAGSWTA